MYCCFPGPFYLNRVHGSELNRIPRIELNTNSRSERDRIVPKIIKIMSAEMVLNYFYFT